jgi:phosphoglycerol transferase MdoB-like AlkP superfamily enzyme
MNTYALIGAVIAALAYAPLTYNVWRGKITQNFATYALWGSLDTIAAISIFLKDGNFVLPAIYTVLSFGIVVAILRTRTFSWSWLETLISFLVLACIVIWAFSGDRAATIASTIAVAVASIPQLVEFWKKPKEAPLWTYVAFTAANGVSILAGKNWSVEERFYPTVCTVATMLFVLIAARRYLNTNPTNHLHSD